MTKPLESYSSFGIRVRSDLTEAFELIAKKLKMSRNSAIELAMMEMAIKHVEFNKKLKK